MRRVSDLFVECLEREGVRYVFGLPGEETEGLLFSLERSSIQFVPTRHEQGAAFMADVWGRLTGEAGVCLSTLGPGATNLVTGIADANLDKSPVVAITGQAALSQSHKESHQVLDVVRLFRPVTKWNAAVTSPEVVPEIVRKAFKIAESEKPGATHIELAEDVAGMATNQKPLPVTRVRRPDPDRKALEEACRLLKRSRRPLIIAGNGAVRKDSSRFLRELARRHHIPAVDTFMGQGAIPDDSPESLFTIGFGFRDIGMEALEKADLILTVGYDLAEYTPDAWNPGKDKVIVHVDFTPTEVYAHYQPAVEVVADIPATLRELNRLLSARRCRFDCRWYLPFRERIQRDIAGYDLKEGEPFTIPGVLNLLRALMGREDLLISDVGMHKIWIARNFPNYCPNGCIISNGLASMGIALPGAVAACLVDPKRRVVAAMGDGGFLMNSQELETASRLGVAFTTLIFNDDGYGMVSWKQRMHHSHATGTKLTNPDFKAYAESFGIRGYRPGSLRELKAQLKEALTCGELAVIEIGVDSRVNERLRGSAAASRRGRGRARGRRR